jgi:hypothetical protein
VPLAMAYRTGTAIWVLLLLLSLRTTVVAAATAATTKMGGGDGKIEIVVLRPLRSSEPHGKEEGEYDEGEDQVSIECYYDTTIRVGGGGIPATAVESSAALTQRPLECCRAAALALHQLLVDSDGHEKSYDDKERVMISTDGSHESCLNAIAAFPVVGPDVESNNGQPPQQQRRVPRFMAVMPGSIRRAAANDHGQNDTAAIVVWDAQRRQRIMVDNEGDDDEQIRRLTVDSSTEFHHRPPASAVLSEAGGMHRHLQLRVPFYSWRDDNNSNTPAAIITATTTPPRPLSLPVSCVHIPLYLPAGLFVNIEDGFRINPKTKPRQEQQQQQMTTTTTIRWVEPIPVIDQEEPSFASTAHGLVMQVCRSHRRTNRTDPYHHDNDDDDVSFELELHARYPAPCQMDNDHDHSNDGYAVIRWRLYNSALTYRVACPRDNDYPAIVLLSVAVSVLGAVGTLRHVAAASRWV